MIKVTLRWIGVLPGAVLCALLARVAVVLINRLTMAPYVDPDSFMGRLFTDYIGGAVLGGVAVYVGTRIAPHHKNQAAMVLAALTVLAAGFLLFPAVAARDYWSIFSLFCMAGGSGIAAYAIVSGELEVGQGDQEVSSRPSSDDWP